VSRLLVQMVRLLGILRANDVACCHLNPDNVLLVPGDSNERFMLMVGGLEFRSQDGCIAMLFIRRHQHVSMCTNLYI
jgi:hypothetical protein